MRDRRGQSGIPAVAAFPTYGQENGKGRRCAERADEGDFCKIRADIVSEIATQQLFKRTFILPIISISVRI